MKKKFKKKTFYKDNNSVKSEDLNENKEKNIESSTEKKDDLGDTHSEVN